MNRNSNDKTGAAALGYHNTVFPFAILIGGLAASLALTVAEKVNGLHRGSIFG